MARVKRATRPKRRKTPVPPRGRVLGGALAPKEQALLDQIRKALKKPRSSGKRLPNLGPGDHPVGAQRIRKT